MASFEVFAVFMIRLRLILILSVDSVIQTNCRSKISKNESDVKSSFVTTNRSLYWLGQNYYLCNISLVIA